MLLAKKHQQVIELDEEDIAPQSGPSTVTPQQQQQLQPNVQNLIPSQQSHKRHKSSKHLSVESELISLQKQTLQEVRRLADLQEMQLEVDRARLEVERELLLMKKAKLMASGVASMDENGCWVLSVSNNKEE